LQGSENGRVVTIEMLCSVSGTATLDREWKIGSPIIILAASNCSLSNLHEFEVKLS
jgi:hypothetical protein